MKAITTVNLHAFSALVFLAIPFVHGWVTQNFHSTMNNNNRIRRFDSVCNSMLQSSTTTTTTTTTTKQNRPLFASTVEDEEILEYLDDDEGDDDDDDDNDEEYDYKEAAAQQAEWMEELQRLSQTTSKDPTAVSDAQEIFDGMFQAYVETDDATYFPTVDVYNLLLEVHAYSPFSNGGEEAERILRRMEDVSNDFVAKPNEDSYLRVMDAWAMRRQPSKAKALLDQLAAAATEGTTTPPVTTDAYNKLIKAHGIAGDFESAESVFRSLRSEGNANHKSWVQLMKALVATGGPSGSSDDDDKKDETEDDVTEETIVSYFEEMEEDGLQPETDAYNVLIRCIGTTNAQEAEAMLFELLERYRSGDGNEDHVRPNAATFRSVLLAHRAKGRGKVSKQLAAKADQLLQIYDGLYQTSSGAAPPPSADETKFVETVLATIVRSRDPRKAIKADRILRKRMARARETPTMVRSVLEAAASTATSANASVKFETFQVALAVYKELRSSDANDATTIGFFLRACHKLLQDGSKRDEVSRTVFRECSEKGFVNDFVLGELERAASENLQLELLGGFLVDGVSIPERWSRNVAGDD